MKQVRGVWLPDGDDHFAYHLEQGPEFAGAGTYQFRKILAALRHCEGGPCRVAVDVGAHVGLWSRVLARHFGLVHAFEPLAHLRECLDANVADCENVRVHPVAVSNAAGVIRMRIVEDNTGNCCVATLTESRTTPVEAITLDDRTDLADLDFLKIDVEGWELYVVEGGRRLITETRPIIVVEQKPGNAERYGIGQRDAVKRLESWGASVLWEKAGDVCLGW